MHFWAKKGCPFFFGQLGICRRDMPKRLDRKPAFSHKVAPKSLYLRSSCCSTFFDVKHLALMRVTPYPYLRIISVHTHADKPLSGVKSKSRDSSRDFGSYLGKLACHLVSQRQSHGIDRINFRASRSLSNAAGWYSATHRRAKIRTRTAPLRVLYGYEILCHPKSSKSQTATLTTRMLVNKATVQDVASPICSYISSRSRSRSYVRVLSSFTEWANSSG